MSFGETLRELRLRNNLTQADLAERIGVSHVYISSLERGAKPAPRHALVLALAHSLGVSEEELWASAQEEREERLRAQIKGQPTSRRTQRSKRPSQTSQKSSQEKAPAEEKLMRSIRSISANRKDREKIIQALSALLDALQE